MQYILSNNPDNYVKLVQFLSFIKMIKNGPQKLHTLKLS